MSGKITMQIAINPAEMRRKDELKVFGLESIKLIFYGWASLKPISMPRSSG